MWTWNCIMSKEQKFITILKVENHRSITSKLNYEGFFSFLLLMWCHRYYTLSLQTGKRPRRVRSQFFIVSWKPQNHKTGNWMKTSSLVIKHQHKTIRGWKHNLILNMLEFGRNWHPFVSHSCQWFLSFISHFQRKASRASK